MGHFGMEALNQNVQMTQATTKTDPPKRRKP